MPRGRVRYSQDHATCLTRHISVVVNSGGVLFCIVEFELDDGRVHEISSPIFFRCPGQSLGSVITSESIKITFQVYPKLCVASTPPHVLLVVTAATYNSNSMPRFGDGTHFNEYSMLTIFWSLHLQRATYKYCTSGGHTASCIELR